MDTEEIVWIVVAVLVALALLALGAWLLRRRSAHQRQERLAHAETLRADAAGRTAEVQSAAQEAQAAAADAEQARARAAEADRAAAEAQRRLAQEQAAQEDVVRRADELDPRVDTTADDYRPVTGPDLKASTTTPDETTTPDADTPGRHRDV